MRFGVCCGADRLAAVKKYSIYEYIEAPLFVVTKMSDKDYARFKKDVRESGLSVEAFNCFFAGDAVLIADGRDLAAITAYMEKAISRAADLGADIVVFGSGNARRIPEDMERAEGERRFVELLRIAGDIAAKNGIRIAIEPLNSAETNLCNTVAETLEICRRVAHPSVGVLCDFYHVYRSGETLDAIENAGELLFHTHIARANEDRCMPISDADVEACRAWAAALKKCGYQGRLSLEGKFSPDFEEVIDKTRRALALFE